MFSAYPQGEEAYLVEKLHKVGFYFYYYFIYLFELSLGCAHNPHTRGSGKSREENRKYLEEQIQVLCQ